MNKRDKILESLKSWLYTEVRSEQDYGYDLENKSQPSKLYHYTTLDGLMGIIQTNTLYASDAMFLNDSSELQYGKELISESINHLIDKQDFQTTYYGGFGDKEVDLLNRVIKQLSKATFKDIYITCFTTESDILSQWRGYSNNSGVRIGFKRDTLLESFDNVFLSVINYNRKSQLKQIEETLGILLTYAVHGDGKDMPESDVELLPQAMVDILLSYVSSFKNNAFKEEREYRLICSPSRDPEEDSVLPAFYRNNGKFIVPYVKLESKRTLLPISDIMIGQSPYSEKIKHGIELLLESNGYERIRVHISKIPYIP